MRSLMRTQERNTIRATIQVADAVALGEVLAGDIMIGTVPGGSRIENTSLIVRTPGAGAATLTVSVGQTGAAYEDMLADSDAKAAAGTVYEDNTEVLVEADADVYAHITATVNNLDELTAFEVEVVVEYFRVYNP